MQNEAHAHPRSLQAAWLLTIALTIGLAVVTMIPSQWLPVSPPSSDKLHHFLAFGVLVLPLTLVQPRSVLWLVPVMVIYGGLIELLQPMFGRSGEMNDFYADIVGIVAGVICGLVGNWFWQTVCNRFLSAPSRDSRSS